MGRQTGRCKACVVPAIRVPSGPPLGKSQNFLLTGGGTRREQKESCNLNLPYVRLGAQLGTRTSSASASRFLALLPPSSLLSQGGKRIRWSHWWQLVISHKALTFVSICLPRPRSIVDPATETCTIHWRRCALVSVEACVGYQQERNHTRRLLAWIANFSNARNQILAWHLFGFQRAGTARLGEKLSKAIGRGW